MRVKTYVIEGISILFILLFVYAAVNKLMDVNRFQVQISQSPLLTTYAKWIAWTIPIAEILISVLLIAPRFKLIGLYAAFSIMVVFTAISSLYSILAVCALFMWRDT